MKNISLHQLSQSHFVNKLTSGLTKLLAANIFLILIIFCGVSCAAQQHNLLALSKGDHTLAIVDANTLKVIARVPVGSDPHEVIASSDGKTAYVSIYGGGSLHEINVIDLVNKKQLFNIDTRPLFGPHGLAFQDGKLWFTAEGSKAIGCYDPATKKVEWCMGTGQDRTHMIYVTADGKNIYTTNVSSGTVSILVNSASAERAPAGSPAGAGQYPSGPPSRGQSYSQWEQTVVPVSRSSEGFDVTPDGRQLWAASADDGTIAIIDLATRKVSATINAKALGANRLAFTPDGKLALVSSLRTGDLYVFNVASHKELKRINLGHGGAGILVNADGSKAFIGCTPDNYVAVVDLKTMEVAGHIDVGQGPDGLALAVRN